MSSSIVQTATRLPTHLDLPCTDDLPVDNSYQPCQWVILIDSVRPHLNRLHPDGQYLAAVDMGIYYRFMEPPLRGCRCPDFFYVPGVPPILPDSPIRRSYVLWNEHVHPRLIIELVSDESRGTEHDQTPEEGKFWIYENWIQAEYYAIYEPDEARIELFHWVDGRYVQQKPTEDGLFAIPPMNLLLGTRYETHDFMSLNWLRWFDTNGEMLETNEERLVEEHQLRNRERRRANREKQRAEKEKQRADQLAAKLRELGIDPESV
jgi:Uma2 family endonuclease